MYGTWESNFADLPRYVNELQHTNPDTIVEFLYGPRVENGVDTFKYVFWAFGPAIRAYSQCIPIICIDGTHLKGAYNGKVLTAVGKNANNQILPVAFAIVDNESNKSWTWFLGLLQLHVVGNRKLCVISDRHQGILHAMSLQTYGWEHRYCLRHIRSNVMKHYKIQAIKKLCWIVSSTANQILFKNAVSALRGVSQEAWDYLVDADLGMWTVYRDSEKSRWGNTTTNIAETLNNVLRHARMMPIRACIEYTFDYTRQHFYDQYREAFQWNSPLSKNIWKIYREREIRSQTYKTTCYDYQRRVYKVQSTYQRSGEGGTDYTVRFAARKCSCERWQHHRLPCSHAISVCSHLHEDATVLGSKKYTTTVWRQQYSHFFNPLRDMSYWATVDRKIKVDPTRLIKTGEGRNRNVFRARWMNVKSRNQSVVSAEKKATTEIHVLLGFHSYFT
ncbi:uncharacterized protein [Rutidosis leptorrhynchoides]|uniref:uncharacterized protein n=1 Tax=Rutidosis leptorrhynchoides TaxID=125765 RepID=UPI003A98E0EE